MRDIAVYTLFSSSEGNCVYFKNRSDEYLIDCGVSARACDAALKEIGTSLANIKAVFVTHEHSDHIRGLDMVCKKFRVPVYAPAECCIAIAKQNIHASPFLNALEMNVPAAFGDVQITPFPTPHDSISSCGFDVDLDGVRFGLATDMGYVTKTTARALTGCRAVIIESNHDIKMLKNGTYPENLKRRILSDHGHLSNESCAAFVPYLAHCGSVSLVLAHLSPHNNTPRAAFQASFESLTSSGAKVCADLGEGDVRLAVAPKCGICKVL